MCDHRAHARASPFHDSSLVLRREGLDSPLWPMDGGAGLGSVTAASLILPLDGRVLGAAHPACRSSVTWCGAA